MHVEKTDGGLIVSGAKVVATTNNRALPIKTKDFAFAWVVPTDSPGCKLFCRPLLRNDGAGHRESLRLSALQPMKTTRSLYSTTYLCHGRTCSLTETRSPAAWFTVAAPLLY